MAARPTHDDALAPLGAARPLWDAYLARVGTVAPSAAVAWKDYTSGRRCVIRLKGRNLAYLTPGEGSFLASTAISEAADLAGLPRKLIAEIAAGPVYPEGRAARIRIDSAASLKTALALLAIKTADVLRAKA